MAIKSFAKKAFDPKDLEDDEDLKDDDDDADEEDDGDEDDVPPKKKMPSKKGGNKGNMQAFAKRMMAKDDDD